MAIRKLSLLVTVSLLAVGCSREQSVLFVTPMAEVARQIRDPAVNDESTSVGQVSEAVLIHRLSPGNGWVFGYREFRRGGTFGYTDQQTFQKLTISVPGEARPSGSYEIGVGGVEANWSAGPVMGNGRYGAYSFLQQGTLKVEWISEDRFHIFIQFDLNPENIFPASSDRTSVTFRKEMDGRVRQLDQLTAWEGVPSPARASAHTDEEGITELIP